MLNTNKILELYATYGWPIARLFVKKTKRCRVCILSEACTELTDGVCAECRRAQRMPPAASQGASAEMAQQFAQVVTAHINAAPYHAVLLLSGGKDSAYILHRMRQAFPDLRMLCVCVNNGFMSPVALKNVTYVADKLGADLLIVNSHTQKFARVLRQAFLDLKGRGSYGVVDKADGDLIFEIGRQNVIKGASDELNPPRRNYMSSLGDAQGFVEQFLRVRLRES